MSYRIHFSLSPAGDCRDVWRSVFTTARAFAFSICPYGDDIRSSAYPSSFLYIPIDRMEKAITRNGVIT